MQISKKLFKVPFYILLILAGLTFSVFLRGGVDTPFRAAVAPVAEGELSPFAKAELSQQALAFIARSYYDSSRIKPKQMLKGGLMAIARSVSEIVVDFPDNTARIGVAVENVEKKFTLPPMESGLEPLIPFLQQVYYFIEKNYKGETELADIERTAINGMLETLDPHSSLLPPKIFKEFKTQTEGEFGGLGIVIGLKEGDLTVISPLEGTPAWKAGIKPKDKIIKIGAEATINMNLNEAVEKLRGKVGSQVVLTITREAISEPFEVALTRAKIRIDSIQAKLLKGNDGDVGYVKVKSFQEDTFRELTKNVEKLRTQSKNYKGLILDFRNNPGGLLNQAVQISDLFLDSGVIVSTVGVGDKIRETEEARALGTEEKYPIVVLVNDASASASEIVAAAIKNNNRGVVMGEPTFGKGSVQSVFGLRDGSALKLTIAEYWTPGNESIQTVGITPDVQMIPAVITPTQVRILEDEGFREKDLEKHLESDVTQMKKPVYQVRYFVPKKEKPPGKTPEKEKNPQEKPKDEDSDEFSTELKLDDDYYVKLAASMIRQTTSWDRTAILKNSAPIDSASKEEEQKITEAFAKVGIDWSRAQAQGTPQAQVTFSVEGKHPSEPLQAGEDAKLTLRVKNVGQGDFYQLIAKSESENVLLKNKEFVFGHVKSGETKSWTTDVKIPESALSREDEIKFVFREANGKAPEPHLATLIVRPKPRPVFAYSYRLGDPAQPLQKGQKSVLSVSIKNLGSVPSQDTVVNLKNLEGEGIYLAEGRNKIGVLEPGATKEAKLAFVIDKSFSKPKLNMELSIADLAVQESITDKMTLNVNQVPALSNSDVLQKPPVIQLTGIEEARSTTLNRFYVSGTVTSDTSLKDVLLFVGENKVYLKSADGNPDQKKIIFSSQVPLENKNNLITVLARDQRDLSSHKSFYIRKK